MTNEITIGQQIELLKKELSLRKVFYPKGFAGAPMKQSDADREIATIAAAIQTITQMLEPL